MTRGRRNRSQKMWVRGVTDTVLFWVVLARPSVSYVSSTCCLSVRRPSLSKGCINNPRRKSQFLSHPFGRKTKVESMRGAVMRLKIPCIAATEFLEENVSGSQTKVTKALYVTVNTCTRKLQGTFTLQLKTGSSPGINRWFESHTQLHMHWMSHKDYPCTH